jgi:hypothetical protein
MNMEHLQSRASDIQIFARWMKVQWRQKGPQFKENKNGGIDTFLELCNHELMLAKSSISEPTW